MPEPTGPVVMIGQTRDVAGVDGGGSARLTAEEQHRAASLRNASDRADYVAAHVLVRECAAQALSAARGSAVDPCGLTLRQTCPTCGSERHGPPRIAEEPGLHVSLAHAPGVVAAAAGWSPVGIDVEPLPRGAPPAGHPNAPDPGLHAAVLTAAERDLVAAAPDAPAAFLRLWVRKEAFVKVGAATLDTLASVDLSTVSSPQGRWGPWTFTDWSDDRCVASVVAAQPAHVKVVRARAEGAGLRYD